jgi:sulfur-oxidizing protein SoxZ
MAENTIRLQAKHWENNGVTETEVKVAIIHPMETGFRKELETGKLIPAHFIEEITCKHNDQPVVSGTWSGAFAKNPYCEFKLQGGKAGDMIEFHWLDNKGDSDTATTKIE